MEGETSSYFSRVLVLKYGKGKLPSSRPSESPWRALWRVFVLSDGPSLSLLNSQFAATHRGPPPG